MTAAPDSGRQESAATPGAGKNVEGHDAVCFTAGPKAAVIGAGTIHAYLASRRKAPRLVAGISLGAINAAAMQRAYRDLQEASDQNKAPKERDATRWRWFRRYLEALSNSPFNVLWKAIPDQSDFFADMIPIRDTSVAPRFRKDEVEARRQLYLKVKLGRWLSQLPVTVRLMASGLVNYVRMLEKYPPHMRLWSRCALFANGIWLAFVVTLRIGLAPQFFSEQVFRDEVDAQERQPPPWWMGWVGWLNLFVMTMATLGGLGMGLAALITDPTANFRSTLNVLAFVGVAVATLALCGLLAVWLRQTVLKKLIPHDVYEVSDAIADWVMKVIAGLYTLTNVGLAGTLLYLAGSVVALSLQGVPVTSRMLDGAFVLVILSIFGICLLPFVIVPPTRRWLVRHRFLAEWPRPLFGWGLFAGSWANLVSLAVTLTLGAYFIATAPGHQDGAFHTTVSAAAAAVLLPAVPALPLVPVTISSLLWPYLRSYTGARRGWRRRVALVVSAVVIAILGVAALYIFVKLLDLLEHTIWRHQTGHVASQDQLWITFDIFAFVLMSTWFMFVILLTQPVPRGSFFNRVLGNVGLREGLLPDLALRQALHALFERPASDGAPAATDEVVSEGPGFPAAVFVASPLQTLRVPGRPQAADQIWATIGTPLQRALRAALAVPPLFSPVRLTANGPDKLDWWLSASVKGEEANFKQLSRGIDLVDGSVIRHNPLPAAFGFLRSRPDLATDMAANNDHDHPALHVVYGVPTEGRRAVSDDKGIANSIVDVGLASLRLSQRRDTQLEVMQTNVIARLESLIPESPESTTFALFADEISPAQDIVFANQLNPQCEEVLDGVAAGCRRSMERLYSVELAQYSGPKTSEGLVECGALMQANGRVPAGEPLTPGLPEVCGRCTKGLAAPISKAGTSCRIERFLGEPVAFSQDHPQLGGQEPRIVLVASGGVFRGAFHIGMLAGLRKAGIKPDLIVGASVGTLMGGAFGSMCCRPTSDALAELTDVFINVDERVALTQTLKNAARELGIRGRAISLSPGRVRRMVRRGARKDAGFASTGAPPALIDALSDLFLIPHRKTQKVASDFVAGDVTGAVKELLTHLRTETIRRLEIQRAVLGTSLLEGVADRLLVSGNLHHRASRQPFMSERISFFGTTTNLYTQSAVLLGGPDAYRGAPYDFVEAALASSAFPAVFAPRAESLVFPGSGNPEVLFADGGMFDNLPFLPAIEVLSQAQWGYRQTQAAQLTTTELLLQRRTRPDLLIAGALDPVPPSNEREPRVYDSIALVHERAGSLRHNVKIRSFELAARRVDSQLRRLLTTDVEALDSTRRTFLDKIVNAGVLAIYPHSSDHLNGTFSFCASTGLKTARVQRSIGDGCFQTLKQLAVHQAAANDPRIDTDPALLTARSLARLMRKPKVASMKRSDQEQRGALDCPFFTHDGEAFQCPFTETSTLDARRAWQMRGVFIQCREDACHKQ